MNPEKAQRDRIVLAALHGVRFDDVDAIEQTDTPRGRFGGLARPSQRWRGRSGLYQDEDGWQTISIEDGAELFFPRF
jgi:hypothetical protein